MIIIREIEGGDVFDLPSDYVIEAEKNNPLFQSKGSQTVPVNFPATGKNNRLLNFPFRIDRAERQEDTIGVIVETDSLQQKGALSVNSASRSVISANIGYDESEMYAVFENLNLNEIPYPPEYDVEFSGNNIDQKIDSALDHMTAVMKEHIERDYCVFPVITAQYEYEVTLEDNGISTTSKNKIYEFLNGLNDGYLSQTIAQGELLARENRIITRVDGNDPINITAPKGYGVCPFIRVWKILEIIFSHFGFTMDENPFKTHRQLKKLCVLNNTMDALLTGKLYYKDMFPDVMIKEFLDGLYAKFGMLYFINSNSRKVTLRLIKDMVNPSAETNNLTKNKTEELSIAFSAPKQLRLKMNRELEDAKVLYDTFEEFLSRFDYQFNGNGATQIFDGRYSRYKIINIFKLFSEVPREAWMYSSDFFDIDKKTPNLPYEDIEMKDLCIPISDYDMFNISEYLVGLKHAYSELIIGGEIQSENANPAKLAFMFSWGMVNGGTPMTPMYYPLGSQFNRDHNGNFMQDETGAKYDISLTCAHEDGLYNRFWKEYDAFIRYSNQEITGKLHLSELQFFNLKMYEDTLIDNQPYLISQIKYKINVKDSISEFKFRTLRLFEPNDLEELWKILGYDKQKYYWAWTETETNPVTHYPGYVRTIDTKFKFDRNFIIINGVQVPITTVSYLPPTEAQYAARERRMYKYTKYYLVLTNNPLNLVQSFSSEVTVSFYVERVT